MTTINFANVSDGTDPYSLTAWAFENAWSVAQNKSATSDNLFEQALTAGGNAPTITEASTAFALTAVEPAVNIPVQADTASVEQFSEWADAVIDKLVPLFSAFIDKYFPKAPIDAAEAWIVKTINEGGTGLGGSTEELIWQRDRERILRDVERAEEATLAAFADRGFPVPPGAAAHAVYLMQLEATRSIAQSSREAAIKAVEVEVENVRFAVQQAVSLYGAAMSAAGDYLRALSIGPSSAMQLIPSVTDSQSRLIGAAADYYRARISVDELRLRAQQPNAEYTQRAREKNADLLMEEIKTRVNAAVAAAQSLGTQAASALNSLHASAGISGGSSNSVGYSYSGEVTSDVAPKTSA